MKKILLLLPIVALTGCNTITYQQGDTKVTCRRAFWSTESYSVKFDTNGVASLDVNKSGVDAKAIADIVTAAANAAIGAVK